MRGLGRWGKDSEGQRSDFEGFCGWRGGACVYDGFHDLGEFDWKSGLIEAIVMIRIQTSFGRDEECV